MSTLGPADDESVVCVTPTEGSVKDEPIEITTDDVRKDDDKVGEEAEINGEGKDDSKDGDDTTEVKPKQKAPAPRKTPGGPAPVEKKEPAKVKVGMVCDRKNLYQKWDRYQRFTWSEEYPDGLEEAAENEQTMKYAILVRNSKPDSHILVILKHLSPR